MPDPRVVKPTIDAHIIDGKTKGSRRGSVETAEGYIRARPLKTDRH
jgi:hypothetical protein